VGAQARAGPNSLRFVFFRFGAWLAFPLALPGERRELSVGRGHVHNHTPFPDDAPLPAPEPMALGGWFPSSVTLN
jgi:hypothetical protein